MSDPGPVGIKLRPPGSLERPDYRPLAGFVATQPGDAGWAQAGNSNENGNGPGTDRLGVIHWQCGFNLKLLSTLKLLTPKCQITAWRVTASGLNPTSIVTV
jgi:hypothetical protein